MLGCPVVGQFETLVTMLRNAKRSPLLGQEGWLRIKKNAAKQPLKAQTGWSLWTDHPVRAYKKDAFGDIV